jgi:hypothetical protein
MIIGKALLKNREREECDDENEDEKTDNDQEVLDFDDDYYNEINLDADDEEMPNDHLSIKEQRKEILNEIDNDLTTLEQLREQKKLLRSIRLRKEELKALEGRRKALEALKTIALDGENQLVQAFDAMSKSKIHEEEKSKLDVETKVKQNEENVKKEQQQPLMRKTFKQSESNENTKALTAQSTNAKIEPSSQIEKSKKTVKHYEDLIRKNISLANENYENKAIMNIDKCDELANDEEELEEKKASLAENERKLKELYSMQERLSQLKEIINHFNGLKKTQNELSQLREESEPGASIVSTQTNEKYEKYLSEQTNSIAEKINTKLNENLESRQIKTKASYSAGDKKDLSSLKSVLEKMPRNEELSEGEALNDEELLEEHKKYFYLIFKNQIS